MITTVKVTEHKLGQFEHAISMLKWPERYVYIGNIIYYLIYLLAPFPKGLEVDLEGRSKLATLMLSIPVYRLGLFCHL